MGTRRSAFAIEGRRNDYRAARPAGAMLAFEVVPDPGLAGALCVAVEPELFFPARGDHATANLAREICARCPVIEACLADALKMEGGRSHSNRFGIRGGLSPNQRYQLARRLRRASRVSKAARPVEASAMPTAEEGKLRAPRDERDTRRRRATGGAKAVAA
ncbi:WhiB family transcriptional regulator [Streptomyces roseoverticillatus]|uniref:WhiB family transcriptional regulator n=1 Tax=Streptomyces roseoverticillatus TaxID=66429 RepID=UPI0033C8D89B